MLKFIRSVLPGGAMALLYGGIGFVLGQLAPAYVGYANEQRSQVSGLIQKVASKSDELEAVVRTFMLVAGDMKPSDDAPKLMLDDKMLDLFQTMEAVKVELPESEDARSSYVRSLIELKDAAAATDGSLTGKRLIEAASKFKRARTDYEARLNELEPSFFSAVFTNIL